MSRRHDFDCDPDQEERYAEWMAHVLDLPEEAPKKADSRCHEFVNSDPTKFDSNCSVCEGKQRDAIHRIPEPEPAFNDHEAKARSRKITRILGVLRAERKTATDAEQMTISEWYALAHKAGVNKPSATSRGMIIAAMKRAEEEDHF